jgi:acetoin utilization deacetylase AcuC-like enzyme
VGKVPFQFSYHPSYHLRLGDHVFPSIKFQRVRDELEQRGLLHQGNLLVPEAATRDQVMLVHSPEWVAALMDGTIRYEQVMKLEIPYSKPMVQGFLYHAGGSIATAEAALKALFSRTGRHSTSVEAFIMRSRATAKVSVQSMMWRSRFGLCRRAARSRQPW